MNSLNNTLQCNVKANCVFNTRINEYASEPDKKTPKNKTFSLNTT